MQGKTILHYKILEKLGSGGMGDVYAAEDTKLHRKVAIKTLPAEVALNPERRSRFEREATAIAALNHPNIVTIHAIEEGDGLSFMAMELVDGEPLRELIPKNGLSMSKFFGMAIPLTDAVAAAHLKGITHRDLKPDNVMVSGDGRVKVLDFGLAKLREEPVTDSSHTEAPTKVLKTEEGVVMGTVAYMSPEQAEGKDVDPRTDVFSLGVMLYEMATGRRPFRGDTKASIISAILRDSPESVTDLAPQMPRHLGRIVKRCLAKDPLRRYQTALEVRNELEELKREIDTGETLPASAVSGVMSGPTRRKPPIGIAAGVIVAAVAIAVWFLLTRGRVEPKAAAEEPIQGTFTRLTSDAAPEVDVSLSPDGKDLAYASPAAGNWDVWVQRVGGHNPINLTKDSPGDDDQPVFSPDGEKIAFRSERDGGGIYVMGATGESVRRLTETGCNPAWDPSGREIAYATECFASPYGRSGTSQLWVVETATGKTRKIFDGDAVQPSWSPDGSRIAYWAVPRGSGQRDIWTIPAGGGDPVAVTSDAAMDWNPVWSPDGRYLYFVSDRSGNMNLWRVPIDQASGRATGPAQAITTGVSAWSMNPSFSADGKRLAYVSQSEVANMSRLPFDPGAGKAAGPSQPVFRVSGFLETCEVSPDGASLACMRRDPKESIVVMRSDGTDARELVGGDSKNRFPRWSPDGKTLAFYSDRSGGYEIWMVRPDGSDLRRISDTPDRSTIYAVWSPDGAKVLGQELRGEAPLIFDADKPYGEQTPEQIPPVAEGDGFLGYWSWSNRDVLAGLLVSPSAGFDGIGTYDMKSGSHRIFTKTGGTPFWLSDGRRLIYGDGPSLMLLDTATGRAKEIASFGADTLSASSLSLPRDDSAIYYSLNIVEADAWLMELK